MSSVALALRVHAPEYLERFGDRVPLGHRKVLGCITRCRTGELGGVQFQCDSCGSDHWVAAVVATATARIAKRTDIRLVGQAD
ncbi:hypothetical protein LF1_51920 [Rubripirellula obstinata]|uniref:Transposase zinc-binding domain-containing protein n=1 Tax=Rubripirellula obstinata TaxID=406547 RepID=A0A5B1CRL9_9BACT|nr:hypothetical protein LF1_51920 [Rubripirellula obstinata]